ncbi:MAG TPA: protease pro-enzyme activation domain-containing protein [Granulicella sp.]|jgi:subtilase family serine protease
MSIVRRSGVRSWLFLAALVSTLSLPLSGQTAQSSAVAALRPIAQANRVAAQANLVTQVRLTGHIPGWATAERQTATAVDLSAPTHVSLLLRRDAAVEAAFEQLLADQQNPSSPLYHHWLTPQQVGDLYGPTQSDLDAITSWATSQGLTLVSVQPNRVKVDFTGSIAVIANAFHTSFANFNLGGRTRLSAISEPSIPLALSSVIQSVHGLTEVHYEPQSKISLHQLPAAGLQPQVSLGSSGNFILPNDFAVIYDIASVYSGGNTGATIGSNVQRIAIIDRSRVSTADITNYETLAGLPTNQPNVVLAGADPGSSNVADAQEATLDVDRVIGTAPGVQADLVISADTSTQDGVDIAIDYNINTLRDPIMTISFGSCEAANGQANTAALNSAFQTALAVGIATFVSAGDNGAAGCDNSFVAAPTSQSVSINSLCASGYVTCVGGTEFNDAANPSTYWSSKNSGSGNESALSYIPEGAWNESTVYNSSGVVVGYQVAAGSGGESIYISKPSWQTGTGVPSGAFRYVPDVSFSAADHDGYLACFAAAGESCVATSSGTSYALFSGTSATAPSMAGIAALLNTKLGSAQGNLNPLLYSVATSTPSAFHDATVATSGVTNCNTATPSICNNSTPGPTTLTGGLAGYQLTAGYDEATGLGSLDVAKFLAAAATPTTTPVSTTLAVTTVSPNPASVNQSITLTATLTPSSTTAGAATGTVQFSANGSAIGSPVTISSNVATLPQAFTTAGTYSITAVYSGDTNYATSTAAAVSLVVNPVVTGSFTLTPSPTTMTLAPGATSSNTDTITLASINGFAGTVSLTCIITFTGSGTASLPPTCSPSSASVTLAANGKGSSTFTIVTQASTSGCTTASLSYRGPVGMMLAGILLLVLPIRRRKAVRALTMVLLLTGGLALTSGCGKSSSGGTVCPTYVTAGTTPGTYTVTVTGTSGSTTQTTTFTLTIS